MLWKSAIPIALTLLISTAVFALVALAVWLLGPWLWLLVPLVLLGLIPSLLKQVVLRVGSLLAIGGYIRQSRAITAWDLPVLCLLAAVELTTVGCLLVLAPWMIWAAVAPLAARHWWLVLPIAGYLGWVCWKVGPVIRQVLEARSERR
jgi:hypothetical protein